VKLHALAGEAFAGRQCPESYRLALQEGGGELSATVFVNHNSISALLPKRRMGRCDGQAAVANQGIRRVGGRFRGDIFPRGFWRATAKKIVAKKLEMESPSFPLLEARYGRIWRASIFFVRPPKIKPKRGAYVFFVWILESGESEFCLPDGNWTERFFFFVFVFFFFFFFFFFSRDFFPGGPPDPCGAKWRISQIHTFCVCHGPIYSGAL